MQTLQIPTRWLTEKEQTSLDQAIERDLRISNMRYPKRWITRRRDASIILFLLNTGVGLAELVAMRLGDVQIAASKGSLLVPSGKRSKPRTIPLNADARKTLQEWLAVRPQSDSDLIWVGVEGTNGGLSTRAVQRILDRYAAEAGLSALTAKACRHTFAKNLESLGVELEKITMLLGLTNVNSTRIYKTPDDGNGNTESGLHKAVQKLEKKSKRKGESQ
jgi:site-specific recombinase XerD